MKVGKHNVHIYIRIYLSTSFLYNPQNEAYIKNKTKRIYLTFVWKQKNQV